MNGEEADPSCFQMRPDLVVARSDEYVAIGPSLTAPEPRRLTRANPVKLTQKQLR